MSALDKKTQKVKLLAGLCIAALLAPCLSQGSMRAEASIDLNTDKKASVAENTDTENVNILYDEYTARFAAVGQKADITKNGFETVDIHIFPVQFQIDDQKEMETELVRQIKAEPGADVKELKMNMEAPILMIPAYDKTYNRLALFFVDGAGGIVYKTDHFATNSCVLGQVEQPEQELASVAFQDLNGDKLTDIILITSCEIGDGRKYRIGDVLFQDNSLCHSLQPPGVEGMSGEPGELAAAVLAGLFLSTPAVIS